MLARMGKPFGAAAEQIAATVRATTAERRCLRAEQRKAGKPTEFGEGP
jgi:hypothetical protein